MALEEQIRPYEVLIRFDVNGAISGTHIGLLQTITKDGVIINSSQQNVSSFEDAASLGFDIEATKQYIDTVMYEQLQQTLQLVNDLTVQNAALTEQLENSKTV
ncbi:hypothetical protein ACLI1A_11625 [Flavobacterium sp. RHBU_3]|uniref:hypothetical protein n=1 Tax=Flavobacterium sp. RHBU_3 TaxID=3391184 RepID=UPI00398485F5